MTFRGIDGSNDWYFGNGRQSYFTKEAAINANVQTRLLIFLGEVPWALAFGIDWWNLLGGKNPTAQAAIILQCRTSIINAFGVNKVTSVLPVFVSATRKLTVAYNIDTIYSRGTQGTAQLPL